MYKSSQPVIQDYSRAELAKIFSIKVVTLNRWLAPYNDEIGPPEKRTPEGVKYSANQVEIIFEKLAFS